MADNIVLNEGTGGSTLATDDDGTAHHQYVKIEFGADNTQTPVSSSNPLPVDNSGQTQPVSGTVTANAGTGTMTVDLGENNDVTIDGSSIVHAEDAAHSPGDAGVMSLAVRNDTLAALAGTDGDYTPLQVDAQGNLYTKNYYSPGTFDAFGHQIVGSLNNQVDVQFFRDTPQNLTTVTTANSGTATSNIGGALFTSSTNANGESKGVSNTTTIYRSGAEVYCLVACTFTTGVANSFQRIGLYDDNNGFFLGYEGTSFGVTYRNNASDTTVAKASFSEDALTGAASSRFTRAGTPEAIDLTKLNVFRIRFGWLGSAPVVYEVLSPDGEWVTFHKTLFPNLQSNPSIRDADLPVTLHIKKTSADATDLQIQTDCWGAGVTTNLGRLDDTITDATLAESVRSILTAKNAGGSYVNIGATNGGNLKVSVSEASDGLDIGAGNAGGETIRVSVATDDVNLASINTDASTIAGDTTSIDGKMTAGEGVKGAAVQRVTIATDDTLVTNSTAILADTASMDTNLGTVAGAVSGGQMQVDVVAALPAGDNNIGNVDIASALPAGTNAIGKLAANSGVDIGDVDVTSISAGSNLIGDVGISGARTSGGTTPYVNTDVDETEDAIKASAGQVYWIQCTNLDATPIYLQFYDATVATVTVGSTSPACTFCVPSQGDANGAGFVMNIPNGIAFATAITVAATTTAGGSGGPGANEVILNVGYA